MNLLTSFADDKEAPPVRTLEGTLFSIFVSFICFFSAVYLSFCPCQMTCKVTVSSTDNLHVPLVLCLILTHSYSSIFSAVLIGIETLDDDEDSDWLGEYQRGCDWEIYTTELSRYICLIELVRCSMTFPLITQAMSIISFSFLNSTFEGSTFCALSEILYQKLGIVLFALEIEDLKKDKSSTRLLLNPAGAFLLVFIFSSCI